MTKSGNSKTAAHIIEHVRTTTLIIKPPVSYATLTQKYSLVRFELPSGYRPVKGKNNDELFVTLHNAVKEGLDAPYKSFTHDRLDAGKTDRWVVYALMPATNAQSIPYQFTLDGSPVHGQVIDFDKVRHHVLVKLLQVAYFRSVNEPHRFVGQDKCYIQVKRESKNESTYICLEMEVTGVPHEEHSFFVDEHARRFAHVSLEGDELKYSARHTYFQQVPLNTASKEKVVFRQLKRSEISTFGVALFRVVSYSSGRPTLNYHATQQDMDETRGYHLHQFIAGFSHFLNQYEFQVDPVWRDFQFFEDKSVAAFQLPVEQMETVYVLDVRFARLTSALQPFLDVYQRNIAGLTFVPIEDISEIPDDQQHPVLIFQDVEKKAFEKDMPLYGGAPDPYQEIYRCYPNVAKQFVNVNTNGLQEWFHDLEVPDKHRLATHSRKSYLLYSPPKTDQKSLEASARDAKVVMNELFMKHLILNRPFITGMLPSALPNWMYVHRESRKFGSTKVEFNVALWVEQGILKLFDLTDGSEQGGKEQFYAILEAWHIDEDFDEVTLKDAYAEDNGKKRELRATYDVIVGPGLCVRIDKLPESPLYDYEELGQRSGLNMMKRPIHELELLPHYDVLTQDDNLLTIEELEVGGYIPDRPNAIKPSKGRHRNSLELYRQFEAFDELLGELGKTHADLSINDLTRLVNADKKAGEDDTFGETVESIVGVRQLQNYYKRLGMFGSLRSVEVTSIYQGIWYTDNNHYVVGATTAMNVSQASAHLVRHVHIQKADTTFSMPTFLQTLSVTFVRLNQFTVLPYPFHLIDMYIENVLQHQTDFVLPDDSDSGTWN